MDVRSNLAYMFKKTSAQSERRLLFSPQTNWRSVYHFSFLKVNEVEAFFDSTWWAIQGEPGPEFRNRLA